MIYYLLNDWQNQCVRLVWLSRLVIVSSDMINAIVQKLLAYIAIISDSFIIVL